MSFSYFLLPSLPHFHSPDFFNLCCYYFYFYRYYDLHDLRDLHDILCLFLFLFIYQFLEAGVLFAEAELAADKAERAFKSKQDAAISDISMAADNVSRSGANRALRGQSPKRRSRGGDASKSDAHSSATATAAADGDERAAAAADDGGASALLLATARCACAGYFADMGDHERAEQQYRAGIQEGRVVLGEQAPEVSQWKTNYAVDLEMAYE